MCVNQALLHPHFAERDTASHFKVTQLVPRMHSLTQETFSESLLNLRIPGLSADLDKLMGGGGRPVSGKQQSEGVGSKPREADQIASDSGKGASSPSPAPPFLVKKPVLTSFQ